MKKPNTKTYHIKPGQNCEYAVQYEKLVTSTSIAQDSSNRRTKSSNFHGLDDEDSQFEGLEKKAEEEEKECGHMHKFKNTEVVGVHLT